MPTPPQLSRNDVAVPETDFAALEAGRAALRRALESCAPGGPVQLSRPQQARRVNQFGKACLAALETLDAALVEVRLRCRPAAGCGKGVANGRA